jgi:hypothetical protein
MRVLQLCHKPPFPAIDGGCLAMHNITSGLLAAGYDVKVLTALTFFSFQLNTSFMLLVSLELAKNESYAALLVHLLVY